MERANVRIHYPICKPRVCQHSLQQCTEEIVTVARFGGRVASIKNGRVVALKQLMTE
jgi:hypothetical protein